MFNKNLYFLLGGLLFAGSMNAQTPRIVLQGSGAPQVFTDFASAVAAAADNDKQIGRASCRERVSLNV